MKTVQIDDDVYVYIVSKIKAFGETESAVLRRELGMTKAFTTPLHRDTIAAHSRLHPNTELNAPTRERSRKSRKADLETLIARGALRVGQTLYLCDYQRKRVPGYEAQLTGRFLLYKDKPYSMSDLAKQLLKGLGYQSNSVRGPMFWCTADGITVKELWEKHLQGNGAH